MRNVPASPSRAEWLYRTVLGAARLIGDRRERRLPHWSRCLESRRAEHERKLVQSGDRS